MVTESLVCVSSVMSHVVSCLMSHVVFVTPWSEACQAPLSMGFPRQQYWNTLSFPSPGDLPDPGIEHTSPSLAGEFFATSVTWDA